MRYDIHEASRDTATRVHDPSGGWHAVVATRVAIALQAGAPNGWVLGSSAGYLVARDPDDVLSPSASYVSASRLSKPPRTGFIDGVPDLAVEVRGPLDPWTSVVERGGIWIANGVRLVWCIDTDPVVIAALRPGKAPLVHGMGDALDARPVLNLQLRVDDLFLGLL